jgi:hypothetical protein
MHSNKRLELWRIEESLSSLRNFGREQYVFIELVERMNSNGRRRQRCGNARTNDQSVNNNNTRHYIAQARLGIAVNM